MRLFLKIFLSLFFIGASTVGIAQDTGSTITEQIEAANQKPIASQKIDALKIIYANAIDHEDKIDAGIVLMSTAYDAKRFDLATQTGEEVYDYAVENMPNQSKLIDDVGQWVIKVYHETGDQKNFHRMIDKNLAMNDAAIKDVFVTDALGVTHRFSGLFCPNGIGDLWRAKAYVFNPNGSDIGCNYRLNSELRNDVSIYFTRANNTDKSQKYYHDNAVRPALKNWAGSEKISDTINADFNGISSTPVLETVLRLGNLSTGYRYTGAWTSYYDGWILKSRISWDGELGHKFGHEKAKALFSSTIKNIEASLKICQDANPEGGKAKDATGIEAMSRVLMLAAFEPVKRPDKACLGDGTNKGEMNIEFHSRNNRIYSIWGPAIAGDVFVQGENLAGLFSAERSGKMFSLYQLTDQDQETQKLVLIKAYVGNPSLKQALDDYVDYYNGDLSQIGSINPKKDGGSDIQISPEILSTQD